MSTRVGRWLHLPIYTIGLGDIDETCLILQEYRTFLENVIEQVKRGSCLYCDKTGIWKCNKCDGKGRLKKVVGYETKETALKGRYTKKKIKKVKCSRCNGKGKGKCTGQNPFGATSSKSKSKEWHAAQECVAEMRGPEKIIDRQMEVDEQISVLKNIKTRFDQRDGGTWPRRLVKLCCDNKFYYMAFEAIALSEMEVSP